MLIHELKVKVMTEIVFQAIIIVGFLLIFLLVFGYSSSKINGKNKKQKHTTSLLSKKTNVREIYNQNINRSLNQTKFQNERKPQKDKAQNSGTRLVVENYNKKLESSKNNSPTSFEFRGGFYPNNINIRYDKTSNFYTNHHRDIQ